MRRIIGTMEIENRMKERLQEERHRIESNLADLNAYKRSIGILNDRQLTLVQEAIVFALTAAVAITPVCFIGYEFYKMVKPQFEIEQSHEIEK